MRYERADFAPLRETGYGIGFHWTAQTVPREGEPLEFEEAVHAFDADAFVEQAVEAGAGHVLFTSTHAWHRIPGPNAEVDRILPGRACKRDLLMEIADGLAAAGIKLMLYYNHVAFGHGPDAEWRQAVGCEREDLSGYYDNYCRVVGWMAEHYGPKVIAFWFDGAGDLAKRGEVPWERMTQAAKAGHPGRLVCHNAGIENHRMYTECQDYWAGEVCRLNYIPRGDLTPGGLPWYSFTSWHGDSRKPMCGHWVMRGENRDLDWTAPCVEAAAAHLRHFQRVGGAVTFNLLCYQDGSAYEPDLAVMRELKKVVGTTVAS